MRTIRRFFIKWFDSRLLTINYEKTKFLPFALKKNKIPDIGPIALQHGDYIIELPPANEIKYLGVTIDNSLKWNTHINNIIIKIRSMLAKFKYLKQFLDEKYLLILYHALVESRISPKIQYYSIGGELITYK